MELPDSGTVDAARNPRPIGMNNCPKCGKWFERKDTLKRHIKIHDNDHRARKSRKKNCTSCIRSKVKCSGDRPNCSRCARRSLSCLYEHLGPTIVTPSPSESYPAPQVQGPPPALTTPPHFLGNASQLLVPDLPQQTSMPGLSQQAPNLRDDMGEFLNWGSFYPRLADLPMWDRAPSNSFGDMFTSYFRGIAPQDTGLDHVFQQAIEQPLQQQEAPEAINLSTETPLLSRGPNLGQTHGGSGASQEPKSNDKESSKLPDLGWAQNVETTYPRRFSLLAVDDSTYESLQNCLRLPLTRIPWPHVSLDAFPSKEKLDYLIDLYFANFDHFLPMVHRPTFNPGNDPALTLAICAIGACFSSLENAQEFAESLCGLLRQLLVFMSEFDASFTRNESHLTAQLMQSVLGKASGSKRLFELGDNNRGIMVANARGMGLFDYVDPVPLCVTDNLQSRWEAWIRVERSKRLAWCIYIFDASATYYRNCRPHLSLVEVKMGLPCSREHWEAGSAQAWAALHPWTTSVPPSVSFRDTLNQLFEKERNPNEHRAGSDQGGGSSTNTSKRSALDMLPDEFHRMLVATTLVRSVWDLRESLNEPAMTSVGPFAYAVFPKNMDAVLSVLDNLTTTALEPAAASMRPGCNGRGLAPLTEREFKGLVLRARVSLIAQIIAADGVTDHLSLACANRRTASEATEQRLLAWGLADPTQPRKLVYVGARLLAISRLYPYHYPREPFDALQGGMLMWTMLRLLRKISCDSNLSPPAAASVPEIPTPSSTAASSTQNQGPLRICQLDWLGNDDATEVEATRDWIHRGGDEFVLRMHGVSNLGTIEGEKQVLWETADVLRGLRVWGVSKTYLDIVTRALQSRD